MRQRPVLVASHSDSSAGLTSTAPTIGAVPSGSTHGTRSALGSLAGSSSVSPLEEPNRKYEATSTPTSPSTLTTAVRGDMPRSEVFASARLPSRAGAALFPAARAGCPGLRLFPFAIAYIGITEAVTRD